MAMNGLGYFGDDKLINGLGSYLVYDKDWVYKDKFPSTNYTNPLKYIQQAPKDLEYLGRTGLIQAFDHNSSGHIKLEAGYFSEAKMIELLKVKEGEAPSFIPYPDNSVYASEETFYTSHQPLLSVNALENKLYLSLPLENKLFIYNLDDSLSLDRTLDLNLTDFMAPQGIPFEDQFRNSLKGFGPANELNYVYMMTNSSILDMNTQGKMTMIKHKTGTKNKGLTSYSEALNLAIKNSRTIYSFVIGGQVVYETDEAFRHAVRIDEMHFIVPYLNDEVEVDYNKFYIYELQKVN